ncbi:nitrilase [Granulicella sp. WH15]|uniref:nitrilase-related carbon-nitrogen hydrolase n=1 Tax=Granulicella sp. WH15 TaxID=2602070 RepID=UPI0013675015|nr:nitrilase-related carbon-nitrogen hydrolase [Granulicella sp. WH15]QHN04837.1 nitrilase [Granulicella sp. WH15]
MFKAAVAQVGSVLFDTVATLGRVERMCREAAAGGTKLLVLPEALLGGYPKGLTFGAVVGSRTDAGREQFRRYSAAAIAVPGPETEQLASWAAELDLHIVVGVIERGGGTLYCTSLVFTPSQGLAAKHRKLMPTGTERLIWGLGDGTTMQAVDTELGRIGVAICWENYMPMYRQYLYDQGVQLWCAPTVDSREIWQASMRHIAYEGRCFVLSACQKLTIEDWQEDLQAEGGEIDGRSLIVSPQGQVIGGPLTGEGLVFADIDLDEIPRGKFDLDVAGHYSRPDVFTLTAKT